MLGNIAFASITHGQGNDDVGYTSTSAHLGTEAEIIKVAEILNHGTEFGERGFSTVHYESAPATVTAFTSAQKLKPRGRIQFDLEHENGKKGKITIADFFADEQLITDIKTGILGKSGASWGIINSPVKNVNYTFTPRKTK